MPIEEVPLLSPCPAPAPSAMLSKNFGGKFIYLNQIFGGKFKFKMQNANAKGSGNRLSVKPFISTDLFVIMSHVTCLMSNAYVDPWDMLNNFCFRVYAQK